MSFSLGPRFALSLLAIVVASASATRANAQGLPPTPSLPGPVATPPPDASQSGEKLDAGPPETLDDEDGDTIKFEPSDPTVQLLVFRSKQMVASTKWFRHMEYVNFDKQDAYSAACTGPCTLHASPGAYRLALRHEGGPSVAPSKPVEINGPSLLKAELNDRSGVRMAGKIVGLTGVLGGLALLVTGTVIVGGDRHDGFIYSGLGTVAAGVAIGIPLSLVGDSASIVVTPLVGGAREGYAPHGAALTVRF